MASLAHRHHTPLPQIPFSTLDALTDGLDQRGALFLMDRFKERSFVAKVIVQRTSGHCGTPHDLFGRGLGIPVLGEQFPGGIK